MGDDLAVAIALLAQTLAAQNVHLPPARTLLQCQLPHRLDSGSPTPSMAQTPIDSKSSFFSAVFISKITLMPSPVAELRSPMPYPF